MHVSRDSLGSLRTWNLIWCRQLSFTFQMAGIFSLLSVYRFWRYSNSYLYRTLIYHSYRLDWLYVACIGIGSTGILLFAYSTFNYIRQFCSRLVRSIQIFVIFKLQHYFFTGSRVLSISIHGESFHCSCADWKQKHGDRRSGRWSLRATGSTPNRTLQQSRSVLGSHAS